MMLIGKQMREEAGAWPGRGAGPGRGLKVIAFYLNEQLL